MRTAKSIMKMIEDLINWFYSKSDKIFVLEKFN